MASTTPLVTVKETVATARRYQKHAPQRRKLSRAYQKPAPFTAAPSRPPPRPHHVSLTEGSETDRLRQPGPDRTTCRAFWQGAEAVAEARFPYAGGDARALGINPLLSTAFIKNNALSNMFTPPSYQKPHRPNIFTSPGYHDSSPRIQIHTRIQPESRMKPGLTLGECKQKVLYVLINLLNFHATHTCVAGFTPP